MRRPRGRRVPVNRYNNPYHAGEVADELNVSRETASWLVGQRDGATADTESTTTSPTDIHVDWSATGRDGRRLSHAGAIMADLLASEGEADVTVGVGKTGAPLATVVSQERETGLTVYVPSTSETTTRARTDSFSQNFAPVADRDCYVVDDNIDTGQTMTETITQVRKRGGTPVGAVVLTDKLDADQIEGVAVQSLVEIVQMGEE